MDAAPWLNDPIDTGAQEPSAPLNGGGDRPLTIRPSGPAAAPPPNAQPSPIQGAATPSPVQGPMTAQSQGPSASSNAPWENDPIDSSAQGGDASAAVGRGLINGVPVAGPYLLGGLDRVAAGVRSLQQGTRYDDELAKVQAFDQTTADQHPVASGVGQFGGAVLSTLPLVAAAPVAFGAEGATMLGRIGYGATTNAAIGGVDAGVRSGGDPNTIAGGAALGGLGGGIGGALGRAAGQVAPEASNGVVDAAGRLGITVPKAVASDNRIVQAAGAGLRNIPFAGEPLMQAAESTLGQLGQVADHTAAGVGTPGVASAGRGIQAAAQRAADQAAADEAAYQARMGQQAGAAAADAYPLAVGGAVQDSVGQLGQRIAAREAAPSQQFEADVGALGQRLGPADRVAAGQDVTQGITRYAQDTLPAQQEAAYNAALGGIPTNARTPLEATRDAASDIMGARASANLPDNVGGAVGLVSQAIRNPTGLTVQGIQTLRSSVGELLKRPTLETSMNRTELQRIYGALSDDLGNAVRTHGGLEAAAAFDRANALTRTGRQAVAGVNRIAQQPPERALNTVIGMAGSSTGGDAARLASIRTMVGDEGFSSVPAAALARLSTDNTGRVSPATFARSIGAMSPEGRVALFGGHAAEVQELAGRAALLANMPADAERPLAERLTQMTRGSPEHVMANIFALASSGSRTNIRQLADLRTLVGEDLWSRVGGALIRRAAFDDATGGFNPDRLVKFAESLTPQARTILSGESAGRPARDAARGMAGQPFNAAKVEAETLKRSLGSSDEGAFSRVAAMASSGSRADVAQLARLRSTMTASEWSDVSATIIKTLGRDVQGQFTPDRYVTAWGKLSGEGKAILFPDKGLRLSLDDIATVSARFKQLNKYANPSGTARNTAFHVGALAAVWTDPITTVSSLVGANVLSRILASPATAKSMARWSQAYELAVTKPAQGTRAGLMAASRGLGTTVADKLGVRLPVESLVRGLPGPAGADGQQHQNRAVRQ